MNRENDKIEDRMMENPDNHPDNTTENKNNMTNREKQATGNQEVRQGKGGTSILKGMLKSKTKNPGGISADSASEDVAEQNEQAGDTENTEYAQNKGPAPVSEDKPPIQSDAERRIESPGAEHHKELAKAEQIVLEALTNTKKDIRAHLKIYIPVFLLLAIAVAAGIFLVFQNAAEPAPVNPYRGGVVIGSCDRAVEIVSKMSLEEKVGQMFITPFRGDGSDKEALLKYHLGGFIYTGDFFGTTDPENAPYVFNDMKEAAEIRPFQAVAEEGGAFVAVSKWPAFRSEPFKLPHALYEEGGLKAVMAQEDEKLIMLKKMGINMNFGPITNIVTSPAVSLYEQTLGQDAAATEEYIRQLTLLYDECGVSSVLKYYTGSDTEAFMMGCYMGAPAVMMANSVVTGPDSVDTAMPLSLSRPWHNYLREELGFNGVIVISDVASPVFDQYSSGQAKSVTAIQAGNNMIWATDYETEIAAVIEAVNNGTISMDDINDSVTRIITWKIRYGLAE